MRDLTEKITKLPNWAREHIADLERERATAITALNDFLSTQKPSPFFYGVLLCTGEDGSPVFKRNYIQAYEIDVEYAGVSLQVRLREDEKAIVLQWGGASLRHLQYVAMIPTSFQSVALVAKDNMD